MEKFIRDNKVAVLVSKGFGAGWYSWHGIEELLYDPHIVNLLLENVKNVEDEICKYCEKKYSDDSGSFSGVDGLTVVWLDQGTEFVIHEYDGSESIQLKSDFNWLTV